jgi:subtilisin family serine protease
MKPCTKSTRLSELLARKLRAAAAVAAGIVAALSLSVIAGIGTAYGADEATEEESTGVGIAIAQYASGRILVDPRPGANDANFHAALRAHGASSMGRLYGMSVHMVGVPEGAEERVAAALARNPNVRFAELDRVMEPAAVFNDPYLGNQWHLPKVNAPSAWDVSTGTGVTIAILDTGVDGAHPDLVARMVPGWNFYNNNADTTDVNGHGTVVAGAAAASSNNGIGVASVAGGAKIMPVRVADANAYTYWSTAAQGINWAADNGARVANLSYVGASASSTIINAAQYLRSKGGVLMVAAGNTGGVDNTAPTPYVMVVAATDQNDLRTSFSTYGSFVDIAAPGTGIVTTGRGGGYWNANGTSLAAPIVAGVAALVISKRPDFAASQIDSTLQSTATDLGAAGADIYYGAGRVNAAAAVQSAAGAPAADTTPPTVAIDSPAGGTASGTVAITASASDNVGVTKVDLKVNGTTVATDTVSPYSFAWDSTTMSNGPVTLTAVAFDAAGNSKVSAPVSIEVSNAAAPDTTPPAVAITSPVGGTMVGSVTVTVNATDNVGVAVVDLHAYGTKVGSTNVAPFAFVWDSTTVPNGAVNLTASAFDGAGNSAVSAPVTVNVSNTASSGAGDTTPPSVRIVSPTNLSTVGGNVTISTSATDNAGNTAVTQTLLIDGVVKATVTGGTLTYKWNTSKVARGQHTITVTAKDQSGNAATAQVQVTR